MAKRKATSSERMSRIAQRAYKRPRRTLRKGAVGYLRGARTWALSQAKHFKLGMPINPFPPKMRTRLTYAPAATYWTPGVNTVVAQYALNGLFQPELAGAVFGTGVQPLYFDQMCTSTGPYKQYKVHGWKGMVKIINPAGQYDDTPSTSSRDCWEVIYQQGFETTSEGDTNTELQSAPNIQRFLLPSGMVNGSAGQQTIHFSGRTRDFVDATVDDSTLAAVFSANPGVLIVGSIGVRSLNSETITAYVQITIEYDVEFFGFDATISA